MYYHLSSSCGLTGLSSMVCLSWVSREMELSEGFLIHVWCLAQAIQVAWVSGAWPGVCLSKQPLHVASAGFLTAWSSSGSWTSYMPPLTFPRAHALRNRK